MKTFAYKHDVRMREADLAGHVFYPNFLAYTDDARHHHFKNLGYDLERQKKEDFIFVVAEVHGFYLKPAVFQQDLYIYMRFEKLKSKAMKIHHVICTEAVPDDKKNLELSEYPSICQHGETVMVGVSLSQKKPTTIPEGFAPLF